MMPRVSVILTSFNHEKYLSESIDSVLNQTYRDLEIIVLDDASTDDSWEIIKKYSDPRMKALRSQGGGEINLFVNKVISEISQGEYVAIHHSDNIWEVDKLAKQVAFLDKNPNIGATFTNVTLISDDGSPIEDPSHYYLDIFNHINRSRYEWLRLFFTRQSALCHPSVLIRKSIYSECGFYSPWLWQIDDFDLWVRLLMKYDIHVMPEKLTRFRVRTDEANTSGNRRDSRIRSAYEYLKFLGNYRDIQNFAELCAIFPEAEKYDRGEDTDLLFALGLTALEVVKPPFGKLFALDLLQEAINDPVRRVAIRSAYDFGIRDLVQLTGDHDVFSLEEVAELKHGTIARDRRILEIHAELSERDAQIANLNRGAVERDELILSLDSQLSQYKTQLEILTQELTGQRGIHRACGREPGHDPEVSPIEPNNRS